MQNEAESTIVENDEIEPNAEGTEAVSDEENSDPIHVEWAGFI